MIKVGLGIGTFLASIVFNPAFMKNLRILLTLAIALSAAAPLAKADTTVGKPILAVPFVITKPGTYRLTKGLTNTSTNPAISILARDVVLDLNGFTISGETDIDTDNVGVVVSGVNVIIRNGTIRKFHTAIADRLGASGTTVEDIICMNQSSIGVQLAGQDSVLRRVIVRNTGASDDAPDEIFGLRLAGSSVIDNCLVQNIPLRADVTSNIGIRLSGGSHVVRETEIHRAFGSGLSTNADISCILERVRIRECGTGLVVSNGQNPLVRESTIRNCVISVQGAFDDGGRNNVD